MDFAAVISTLNDLSSTFKRPAAWYTQLVDSTTFELALESECTDDVLAQVQTFGNAQDGWIDVWGLLVGVPRNQNEGNIPYAIRIVETMLAWFCTLPAIQAWINLFAPGGNVSENLPGVGYVITLPASMNASQIVAFIQSLGRIRPAGVPFTILQGQAGLFLGTDEFLGTGMVMGNYLTPGAQNVPLAIGATTLSAQPLLPALYFQDPILNPSLAPPVPLA